MSITLTLENIPDEVYGRLKVSADANRRSMNSEAIGCLEVALMPEHMEPAERLARARALRTSLQTENFSMRDIAVLKRTG